MDGCNNDDENALMRKQTRPFKLSVCGTVITETDFTLMPISFPLTFDGPSFCDRIRMRSPSFSTVTVLWRPTDNSAPLQQFHQFIKMVPAQKLPECTSYSRGN